MSGQNAAVIGLGILAALLGTWGIFGALRTRRRRAEIAPTYGSTGGIVFTIVQLGCAGALVLGGLILVTVVLLAKR
jgi:CHASE2 domain-containing sensor protein